MDDETKQKLETMATRSGVDVSDVVAVYNGWMEKIKDRKDLPTTSQKSRYALTKVWREYIARPPVDPYTVIPIGAAGTRMTSGGKKRSVIFALVKGAPGIQQIVCLGSTSEKYLEITPFMMYEGVKLGRFKGKGGEEGDFVADSRAIFENPKRAGTHDEILRRIGIKTVTISDCQHSREALSHQTSDGYTDRTDWRCIVGQIHNMWNRWDDDEEEAGLGTYFIVDDSIFDQQPTVTPDGEFRPPGMTVWTHPNQQDYGIDDEVKFYGPVSLSKKSGEPQMNAYLMIPVFTT